MSSFQFEFRDRVVSYDTFMDDLATRVAVKIKAMHDTPRYICQKQAFKEFGEGNVRRWRKSGKVEPRIRPGKVEFLYADLVKAQDTVQDYFD